jgi:hypothetical protein
MIPLTFILINLAQALWHWYRIVKNNELITSKRKTLEYALASILVALIILGAKGSFKSGSWLADSLPLILFCFLTRLAFYDPFLNVFRKLPIAYEGQISKKKSFYDWFESQSGLPVMFLRVVYLAAFLIYLIIYLRN